MIKNQQKYKLLKKAEHLLTLLLVRVIKRHSTTQALQHTPKGPIGRTQCVCGEQPSARVFLCEKA